MLTIAVSSSGRPASQQHLDRIASIEFTPSQEIVLSERPSPEITLYTSAICHHCVAAKNFLKSKGQTWTEVRIDQDPAERERMIARARRTSVPQIFIGQTHVGGYDDMIALHREGGLEPLLAGAA